MRLDQLKVIVTGGASGMGAHFAKRLFEAGAKVAVGDVNEGLLKELPAGIATRKLDVSSEKECEDFVAWAHGAMGGLNALVNNAGVIRDGLLVRKDKETGAIKKATKQDWDTVIGVSTMPGAMHATRTPKGASSRAHVTVFAASAAFAAT